MKLVKQISAWSLIIFGFLIGLGAIGEWVEAKTPEQRIDAVLVGLVGIPITTAGGWLLWQLAAATKQAERDRLQAIFYQLLQENGGQITVLRFAMESHLSADQARTYLNEHAKAFNAEFEPLSNGDITYQFHL